MQELSKDSTLQDGKYIIEKVLGQGGFGITYLAQVKGKRNKVALKEFFPMGIASRDENTQFVSMQASQIVKLKKKFLLEADKIRKLNHPNVIKALDVFEENGTAYYVMEYINGEQLSDLIDKKPPTLEEALLLIIKIARALEHVHSHRMLHLDIKPVNIMVKKTNNEPVLIDFGISKTYDDAGNPNTTLLIASSHGYSPAEQRFGDLNSFCPATDVFALGATFFKLITHNNPPAFPTPQMAANLAFDPSIPTGIQEIVRKSMQYDKQNRYQTVKEFLMALEAAVPKKSKESELSIRSFSIKTPAPYYVDEEIDICWNVQNCDAVYLNGRKQTGLRKTKTIKYNSIGIKRLTLKIVKGSAEVSQTLNFEIISKPEKIEEAEATQIIVADVEKPEKPIIRIFAKSGTDKVYVGDEVSVYWQVKGADTLSVNGVQVPKNSKRKTIIVDTAGEISFTLIATNTAGTSKKTFNITAYQHQAPKIKQFYATITSNLKVGDGTRLVWVVEDCDQVRLGRDEIVPNKGGRQISFRHPGSYAYTLHATNRYETETKTIYLSVKDRPKINAENQQRGNATSQSASPSLQKNDGDIGGCLSMLGQLFLCSMLGAAGIGLIAYLMPPHPTTLHIILAIIGFLLSIIVPFIILIKIGKK